MNNTVNLFFSADNRVYFALLSKLCQIFTELIESRCFALSLFAVLFALGSITLSAGNRFCNKLQNLINAYAKLIQKSDCIRVRLFDKGHKQMLSTDKRVAHTSCNLERQLNYSLRTRSEVIRRQTGRIACTYLCSDKIINILCCYSLFVQN